MKYFRPSTISILACSALMGCDVNHALDKDVAGELIAESALESTIEPQNDRQESMSPVLERQEIGLNEAVNLRLSKFFNRPMQGEIHYKQSQGKWSLVCGTPKEKNGSDADYTRSALKKAAEDGILENSFCSLMRVSGSHHEIVEFDIGSTDSPVLDWYEKYVFPATLMNAD